MFASIFFTVLIVLVIVLAFSTIKIVKQSEVIIVERLGKYWKTGESGLNIVIPILDRVVKRIDLRTQVIDSPPQPVITKDNVTMSIDTVVYYQITDSFKATYEIANLVQAIRYLTTTTLRDVIGTMELDRTLSSRDDVNNKLRIILDEATDKWGVRVERVEIKNIDLPADIKEAMEKQMRAEREKRAVILQAEGTKQAAITGAQGHKESQILKAEGEKQTAILHAEAKRESQIRIAEGEAEAINKIAEAEANRVRMVYEALKNANVDEAMLSVKYVEALSEMAKGENKVFIPYESQGLLGSIGAIKELIADKK
ncbi:MULTISPECIES: SPFH domain-containing protein [Paraclostridium]|jgi:regulator of protease activity HflC (stomatin/prohibitin superfamily)|uniref:SPFH/Band 7/PHB domain protein n=1 Tax=Paraclostridium bifermentans TaxID=1490 RepID=A0A5P3XDR0_PARBF|nr:MULTISPECIES: SPFH domain-containing protein [Paraclostridium]MCU9809379.1 SPFH/Band 7/PHB domain protein [Paraclostridium sp. AKS46]MDV8110336.1 SPFH domain-containing protein [Bacillus sp. BAU-SS-2023]EQK45372.1 SPFH domain / Band 7 family protein [[Clostridium] bifermentans ATCC 19299] [Paraclostridium bifermentans ATCC 19299]MBZ6006621.1 SPFH/Band 7/PHB domain protein [Paraclostridium bifermentans]MCE9674329.1 SPFH/Band 7/PHB domain protein [Paraclostridium bifermentans]